MRDFYHSKCLLVSAQFLIICQDSGFADMRTHCLDIFLVDHEMVHVRSTFQSTFHLPTDQSGTNVHASSPQRSCQGAISGSYDDMKAKGKLDGFRKRMTRQSKDERFHDLWQQLANYGGGLQILLSGINLQGKQDPLELLSILRHSKLQDCKSVYTA